LFDDATKAIFLTKEIPRIAMLRRNRI